MNERQAARSAPFGEPSRTEMAHGHTRLIWLLDDIEAHLDGLADGADDHELILEELVSFARSFTDELGGHIQEEESEIFPQAEQVAGEDGRRELAEILEEHRQLQAELDELWALFGRAADGLDVHVSPLLARVRALREHLSAHSRHERLFLSRMEARVHAPTDEV